MGRPKNCWKCHEKVANRPGGICYSCWTLSGMPSRDAVIALRRELDPEWIPNIKKLSEARTDDLIAMERVWDGKPIETVQEQGFKELLKTDGRSRFFDRMTRMRGQQTPAEPLFDHEEPQVWDGVSECPCCHRGPVPEWEPTSQCPTCKRDPWIEEPGPARELAKRLLLETYTKSQS